MLRKGDTELEAARRYSEAATALLPLLVMSLEHVLRLHIREQLRHDAIGRAELAAGSLARLPGGIGLLRRPGRLHEARRAAAGRGAGRGHRAARRARPRVRRSARAPCEDARRRGDAGLSGQRRPAGRRDRADRGRRGRGRGLPQSAGGRRARRRPPRAGDWYGRPVNLASRITDIAYPGSVLCASEVRDAAANGHRWSFAGRRRLKGIGAVEGLFRVRRQAEGGSGG